MFFHPDQTENLKKNGFDLNGLDYDVGSQDTVRYIIYGMFIVYSAYLVYKATKGKKDSETKKDAEDKIDKWDSGSKENSIKSLRNL